MNEEVPNIIKWSLIPLQSNVRLYFLNSKSCPLPKRIVVSIAELFEPLLNPRAQWSLSKVVNVFLLPILLFSKVAFCFHSERGTAHLDRALRSVRYRRGSAGLHACCTNLARHGELGLVSQRVNPARVTTRVTHWLVSQNYFSKTGVLARPGGFCSLTRNQFHTLGFFVQQ